MKSRSQKRDEAVLRNEKTRNLSPTERLSQLDKTFGASQGAKKERTRLSNMVVNESSENVKPSKTETK